MAQKIMALCFLLALLLASTTTTEITESCISCIGKVEDGSPGCNWDVGSLSCGKYQLKEDYWNDCQPAGKSWKSCANNDTCARQCIRNYTSRYAFICKRELGKSSLTCYDYGRLHNGGPHGCGKKATLVYVDQMKRKCKPPPSFLNDIIFARNED